jgi:hypothetical protein
MDVNEPHIIVHGNALRAYPSPLNAPLKGDWAEGHNQDIDWTKQDGPMIDCFAEYLYLHDYSVTDPQPCTLVPNEAAAAEPEPALEPELEPEVPQ